MRSLDSGDAAGLLSRCFARAGDDVRADVARSIAALGPDARAALLELAGWHAVTQAIQGALGRHLAVLPEDCAAYIEATSHLNARRNARLVAQVREIAAATGAAGLAPVFLKGAALVLGSLHADAAARLVGDIDLLVEPGRLEDTAAALVAAGYRRLPDRVPHAHDPLRLLREDRPGLIELHVAPVAFALAPALSTPDMLGRALPASLVPDARVPCPEDLVVHCLAHALLQDHGFRLSELRLRDALDLARLAERHAGAIDWQTVEGRLGRVPGGRDAFAFGLLAAREAVAAPLPAPPANPRVARHLAAWRRRGGGPATPIARGSALLGAYAEDWLGRLRHAPDQRRHLVARLLSPRAYPGIVRTLAAVATEGPPATPHAPPPRRR